MSVPTGMSASPDNTTKTENVSRWMADTPGLITNKVDNNLVDKLQTVSANDTLLSTTTTCTTEILCVICYEEQNMENVTDFKDCAHIICNNCAEDLILRDPNDTNYTLSCPFCPAVQDNTNVEETKPQTGSTSDTRPSITSDTTDNDTQKCCQKT